MLRLIFLLLITANYPNAESKEMEQNWTDFWDDAGYLLKKEHINRDGSHKLLERWAKKGLFHPNTYQHVSTEITPKGGFIEATCIYMAALKDGTVIRHKLTIRANFKLPKIAKE